MGNFFKNNEFKTDYKKRPNDEYKALYEKLDDETKKKFDRRRTWILTGVLAAVFVFIIILAVTGIGTNKAASAGTILDGTETAEINCLGDSVTAGTDGLTYPEVLKNQLEAELKTEFIVRNYGEEGLARNTSYKQMSETADIVILQYLYENFKEGEDPEGVLEANIDGLTNQGCLVYLINYPSASFAQESSAVKQANQFISKASKEKSILLLDASAYFQGLMDQGYTEEELFLDDGVHLTESGYEQLGKFIAGGLISDAGLN
ncbi:MAG: hypothetical protein IKE48_03870 [Parasporobacterium sp.]|nr:hypothetical protein [Parasporobacterium sp.]